MKNKITYEMEDIVALIAYDLRSKGMAPDTDSMVIRAQTMPDSAADLAVTSVEVDVHVSWVGTAPPVSLALASHDTGVELEDYPPIPRDLLDEAPKPGVGPAVDIGDVASVGQQLARSSTGPFSPDKVKRRLTGLEGESTEYLGASSPRGTR